MNLRTHIAAPGPEADERLCESCEQADAVLVYPAAGEPFEVCFDCIPADAVGHLEPLIVVGVLS